MPVRHGSFILAYTADDVPIRFRQFADLVTLTQFVARNKLSRFDFGIVQGDVVKSPVPGRHNVGYDLTSLLEATDSAIQQVEPDAVTHFQDEDET